MKGIGFTQKDFFIYRSFLYLIMKPPVCCICDKNLEADEGGLVYFKRRPSDLKWDERAKQPGFVGHPPYAEWFCGRHYERAKELSDLTIDIALKKLK